LKKLGLIIISVILLLVFQQKDLLYGAPASGEKPDPKEKKLPIKSESKTDDKQEDLNPFPLKTIGGEKTNKHTADSKKKTTEQKITHKKIRPTTKDKQEKQPEKQEKKILKASKGSPFGYCCYDGTLRSLSEQLCITKDGRFFSSNRQPEADKFCRRTSNKIGFCCLANKIVVKLDKSRCHKRQGRYYSYKERLAAYTVCRIFSAQQSQDTVGDQGTINNNSPPKISENLGSQNTPYGRLTIDNQTEDPVPVHSGQSSHQKRTETETPHTVGRFSQREPAQQDIPEEPVSDEPAMVDVGPQSYIEPPPFEQFAGQNIQHNQIVVSIDGAIDERELVSRLSKTFQLKLIDLFTLKSLGRRIAVFSGSGDTTGILSELGRQKGVLSVQPNKVFTTMGEPMTAMQNLSRVIDFDVLHSRYRGKSIRIGIVDTGIDYSHHELNQRVVHYQNFFSDSDYIGELHGTAVAGIIGASINGKGIQGVAPEADLYAFRGCRQRENGSSMGLCYSTTIARALDAAIDNQVHLVSLCLGTSSSDNLVAALLEAGVDRDILFIAPAGNSADQPVLAFPASHEDVISVAGIDGAGKGLPNSPVAAMANVRAPAAKVLAPVPGNRYNFMDGTSMASAAVAGVLALVLEKHGALSPEFLYSGSVDLKEYISLFFDSAVFRGRSVVKSQVDKNK